MQTAHTITLLKNFCMDLLDHLVDTTGNAIRGTGVTEYLAEIARITPP
jgi:hypothetical protein